MGTEAAAANPPRTISAYFQGLYVDIRKSVAARCWTPEAKKTAFDAKYLR
jgi:hypothetical protein